jgi:ElaB/YqjD/DUF883 family membrane-anchored ribosome-binding protein
MFDKKSIDHAGALAEQLVHSADQAVKSTQRVAIDALDTVRDTSRQLRRQAQHTSDSTVDFIRDEPVKSVLIAAAAGAALTGLISLLSRPRERH